MNKEQKPTIYCHPENRHARFYHLSISELQEELNLACANGNLDMVRFLLTDAQLMLNPLANGQALGNACAKGHLEVARYLLTSPELRRRVSIHADNDIALRKAAGHQHIDLMHYLLTSPELREHADLHAQNNEVFFWALSHRHSAVLECLIVQFKLKRTKEIQEILTLAASMSSKQEMVALCQQWFERSEINHHLHATLSPASPAAKKHKI